jgi:hypothetical protein
MEDNSFERAYPNDEKDGSSTNKIGVTSRIRQDDRVNNK